MSLWILGWTCIFYVDDEYLEIENYSDNFYVDTVCYNENSKVDDVCFENGYYVEYYKTVCVMRRMCIIMMAVFGEDIFNNDACLSRITLKWWM